MWSGLFFMISIFCDLFNKSRPTSRTWNYFSMLSPRSHITLPFTLRSMIYLKMIFMYVESRGPRFIFSCMDNQRTQHHFIYIKKGWVGGYYLLHYSAFFAINQVHIYKDLFVRSIFFWSIYLFLNQNHVDLITVAL